MRSAPAFTLSGRFESTQESISPGPAAFNVNVTDSRVSAGEPLLPNSSLHSLLSTQIRSAPAFTISGRLKDDHKQFTPGPGEQFSISPHKGLTHFPPFRRLQLRRYHCVNGAAPAGLFH